MGQRGTSGLTLAAFAAPFHHGWAPGLWLFSAFPRQASGEGLVLPQPGPHAPPPALSGLPDRRAVRAHSGYHWGGVLCSSPQRPL